MDGRDRETAGPDTADVAIVGAGVAGLGCAWRLLREDPSRRVVVFDMLGRVGGRLDTDLVHIRGLDRFDDNGQVVRGDLVTVKEEEGGMRFNAAMPELLALIDALGLWDRISPFGMGDDGNYFHIRGRSFTAGESKRNDHAIWSELYDLRPSERNKSPGEIVLAVYRDLVFGNGDLPPDNPSPAFWQKLRLDFSFQGVPLSHWGLWSLYRAFGLSEECIAMLADTTGFRAPFYGRSNAGVSLQLLEDFPLDPKFFALEDGFGSLPLRLQERIEHDGGRIILGAQVLHVRPLGNPVADGEHAGFELTLRKSSQISTMTSGKLILALPPLALERLLDASPELPTTAVTTLRHACRAVVPQPLCKVNLYYRHAWWRDHAEAGRLQIKNGGSFTTLPLGAVYVFDPVRGEAAEGPAGLTIYSDDDKTEFWQQLQDLQPAFTSALQREHNAVEPQVLFPASEAVVTEATAQLREMFRMLAVPRPVLTSFRHWSGEREFGYAYHQWGRGTDDRAVAQSLVNPMPGLYVCNEAFSDDQGWVNGSLRSASRVLQAGFGIPPLPHSTKMLPGESPTQQGQVREPLAVEG